MARRITDRGAIRMALYLAIDCEETEDDPASRRNVAAFKRVLDRYFGGHRPPKIEDEPRSLRDLLAVAAGSPSTSNT